jgi:hypothetical protein
MKMKKLISFSLIYVALLTPLYAKISVPDYNITSLKAMLFYSNTGTFSEDILSNPNFALWNVIIGAGSAKGPSQATFIIVEITGTPGSFESERKVMFQAQFKHSKKVVKHVSDLGVFSKNGKYLLGFWLYDTGCDPVTLNVRLTSQNHISSLSNFINFACGE